MLMLKPANLRMRARRESAATRERAAELAQRRAAEAAGREARWAADAASESGSSGSVWSESESESESGGELYPSSVAWAEAYVYADMPLAPAASLEALAELVPPALHVHGDPPPPAHDPPPAPPEYRIADAVFAAPAAAPSHALPAATELPLAATWSTHKLYAVPQLSRHSLPAVTKLGSCKMPKNHPLTLHTLWRGPKTTAGGRR